MPAGKKPGVKAMPHAPFRSGQPQVSKSVDSRPGSQPPGSDGRGGRMTIGHLKWGVVELRICLESLNERISLEDPLVREVLALDAWKLALKGDPGVERLAQLSVAVGEQLSREGLPQSARRAFELAGALREGATVSNELDVHLALVWAQVLLVMGEYDDAEPLLEAAHKRLWLSTSVWDKAAICQLLGEANGRRGRFLGRATRYLEAALWLEHPNFEAGQIAEQLQAKAIAAWSRGEVLTGAALAVVAYKEAVEASDLGLATGFLHWMLDMAMKPGGAEMAEALLSCLPISGTHGPEHFSLIAEALGERNVVENYPSLEAAVGRARARLSGHLVKVASDMLAEAKGRHEPQ